MEVKRIDYHVLGKSPTQAKGGNHQYLASSKLPLGLGLVLTTLCVSVPNTGLGGGWSARA